MSDDEFSKQAGKAFQNVAIGAAGLVGGLPAVALTVGVAGVFNVFESFLARKSEAFNEARFSALEDEVRKVADEVRKIQEARAAADKPIDPPDPLTQGVLFSEFAEAVASAPTPEKRVALVHAAARQFDPDAGAVAIRKHWFDEVKRLGDLQILAIRLLAEHAGIAFSGNDMRGFHGDPNGPSASLPFSVDERVAVEAALAGLAKGPFVSHATQNAPGTGRPYRLSLAGHILARYIRGE